MSEIKAQLLGVLLVLSIFGVVAGTLTAVFTKAADNVEEKVNSVLTEQVSPKNPTLLSF